MTLSPAHRAFLRTLSSEKQGRTDYSLLDYDKAMEFLKPLLDAGYVRNRRMGIREGVQLTDAGRSYLGGEG